MPSTNVIPLTSTEAVDKAWECYANHMARLTTERGLIEDRQFIEEAERLRDEFRHLYLAALSA